MGTIIAAAIQMNSGDKLAENLQQAEHWIAQAVAQGANVILLPENFALMGDSRAQKLAMAEALGDLSSPIQKHCSGWAMQWRVTLVAGSLPTQSDESQRVYATQAVFNAQGELQAHYHKIHLFDVDLPGKESYKESNTFKPGEHATITKVQEATMGLSICYDLRFANLYTKLRQAGADIVTVPAAFTYTTGKAHWKTLLSARAIEQQVFIIAANQCASHPGNRQTYGHSMILDPWGRVLAEAGEEPGVIVAELDMRELQRVRASMPVAQHKKTHIKIVR